MYLIPHLRNSGCFLTLPPLALLTWPNNFLVQVGPQRLKTDPDPIPDRNSQFLRFQNPNSILPIIIAILLPSSHSSPFFSSGLHLPSFSSILHSSAAVPGHTSHRLLRRIRSLQDSISSLESCRKPILAAVHGGCIGGGVDLITACDVRFCTRDAYFSVNDHWTIVGYGNAFEMAITGRRVGAEEAKAMGLVSRVFDSQEELIPSVNKIAEEIASKSPLAVTGTKAVLLKSSDVSVDQGLDYVAVWNSGMTCAKL